MDEMDRGELNWDEDVGIYLLDNFKNDVKNLKVNDKRVIDTLTEVAGVAYDKAIDVVRIIANTECPTGLLKLYLIDSIIKKIGGAYVDLFNDVLVNSFRSVFLTADSPCREKMFKLRLSWNGLVSEPILRQLDTVIHQIDKGWPTNFTYFPVSAKLNQKCDTTNAKVMVLEDVVLNPDNDKFSGSHGVIRKTKVYDKPKNVGFEVDKSKHNADVNGFKQIINPSTLHANTKIAVPVTLTKDGMKFGITSLEKERKGHLNSIGTLCTVKTNDATDDQNLERLSTQEIMQPAVVPKGKQRNKHRATTIPNLSKDVQNSGDKQEKVEISEKSNTYKLRAATRHRGTWIDSDKRYVMSDEIYNDIYSVAM